MPQTTVVVGSRSGLHARPVSLLAKKAATLSARITIGREGDRQVDARSLLGVLGLAVAHGEAVLLTAEGDDADAALAEVAALLSTETD
ncbi:HPr family phosphocarrier protein [Streptomyces arenae]|uniref:HPr family phosphocarrier protein n=1 Tax=Streptomyces arenae TaxID=29301 RepID=UPI00265B1D00|nr:HPr family phosphocarrier protein [Streptomyces arenae]MCG7205111.1 HPr family phosphocarrier protein [Streptomyces arenae]